MSTDPYSDLLAYRTTPLENDYSPAQLLYSRQLCTDLPMTFEQWQPKLPDASLIIAKEEKQKQWQKLVWLSSSNKGVTTTFSRYQTLSAWSSRNHSCLTVSLSIIHCFNTKWKLQVKLKVYYSTSRTMWSGLNDHHYRRNESTNNPTTASSGSPATSGPIAKQSESTVATKPNYNSKWTSGCVSPPHTGSCTVEKRTGTSYWSCDQVVFNCTQVHYTCRDIRCFACNISPAKGDGVLCFLLF